MGVQGSCEAGFEQVREEFERNFAERGELGASVCVVVDGNVVVDLWAGSRTRPADGPGARHPECDLLVH